MLGLGLCRSFLRGKFGHRFGIPLNSKHGPVNYYKGKRCPPTGFHTRKGEVCMAFGNFEGGYVAETSKAPSLNIPDLTGFEVFHPTHPLHTQLKPFVSYRMAKK